MDARRRSDRSVSLAGHRRRHRSRVLPVAAVVSVATLALALPATASPADSQAIAPLGAFAAGLPACSSVPNHFGRMFSGLAPATWSRGAVDALAGAALAAEEADPTPEDQVDDEENLDIDAGYTYVGQFIDHDLTKEQIADLEGTLDPTTVVNERTARFDLDSVYGAGPSGSPQLFAADRMHLVQGARISGATGDSGATDHPRDAAGQALIGDPRDDENRLVASLHAIVARFHNLEVDRIRSLNIGLPASAVYQLAHQVVLWHYQWAVLTDFLPTIAGQSTVSSVLPSVDVTRGLPDLRFYDPCSQAMPVEFSVAAYRFGHSQVRALYRMNSTVPERRPVFGPGPDFSQTLAGFGPTPQGEAIDWDFFFAMNGPVVTGHPQDSYKIDGSLVFPLGLLPLPATGGGPTTLTSRNLLRAEQLGGPSGQDVATAMGVTPLRDDQILVGKATGDPADAQALTSVSPEFTGKSPLWTYVLAEAVNQAFSVSGGQIQGGQIAPNRLGPVGGRIVAETFVGLLGADRTSVLFAPGFRPDPVFARNGKFGFREMIAAATGRNLSLGQPTTPASATAVADGNPATDVQVSAGTTRSVTVDLGASTALSRIQLTWSSGPSGLWTIGVGEDPQSIGTVAASIGGPPVYESLGLSARGRYVRVTAVTGSGGRLAELETFRPADLPAG